MGSVSKYLRCSNSISVIKRMLKCAFVVVALSRPGSKVLVPVLIWLLEQFFFVQFRRLVTNFGNCDSSSDERTCSSSSEIIYIYAKNSI